MKNKFILILLLLLVSVGTAFAVPVTIDFEGITTDPAALVPNGYGHPSLSWHNTAVTVAMVEDPTLGDNYVAFGLDLNPVEFSSSEFFTLESFDVASMMGVPGMTYNVEGFHNGQLAFWETGLLADIMGGFYTSSNALINGVKIWADEPMFFLTADNVVIDFGEVDDSGADPVPEPATMLLLGLGIVGFIGFRKHFS